MLQHLEQEKRDEGQTDEQFAIFSRALVLLVQAYWLIQRNPECSRTKRRVVLCILLPVLAETAVEIEHLPARLESVRVDVPLGRQKRAIETRIGPGCAQRRFGAPCQRQQAQALRTSQRHVEFEGIFFAIEFRRVERYGNGACAAHFAIARAEIVFRAGKVQSGNPANAAHIS